jgi:hypothetical protein
MRGRVGASCPAAGRAGICSKTWRIPADGVRQRVRYVSTKGSQSCQPLLHCLPLIVGRGAKVVPGNRRSALRHRGAGQRRHLLRVTAVALRKPVRIVEEGRGQLRVTEFPGRDALSTGEHRLGFQGEAWRSVRAAPSRVLTSTSRVSTVFVVVTRPELSGIARFCRDVLSRPTLRHGRGLG